MNSKESEDLILFCSETAESIYKICDEIMGLDWTYKTKTNPKLALDDLDQNWIPNLNKQDIKNQDVTLRNLNINKTIEYLCCFSLCSVERAKFHASNQSLIPCVKSITQAYINLSDLKIQLGTLPLITDSAKKISQKTLTNFYKNAAIRRWKTDPKIKDKEFIKDCWLEWQKNPIRYKNKASFARDMLEKVEYLNSSKVIEDWCREWDKEKV